MSDEIKPGDVASPSASGSAMAATNDRLPTDSLRLVLQLEDTETNRFIMEQAHETLKRQVVPETKRRAILKLEQIRLTSVLLPKSPNDISQAGAGDSK